MAPVSLLAPEQRKHLKLASRAPVKAESLLAGAAGNSAATASSNGCNTGTAAAEKATKNQQHRSFFSPPATTTAASNNLPTPTLCQPPKEQHVFSASESQKKTNSGKNEICATRATPRSQREEGRACIEKKSDESHQVCVEKLESRREVFSNSEVISYDTQLPLDVTSSEVVASSTDAAQVSPDASLFRVGTPLPFPEPSPLSEFLFSTFDNSLLNMAATPVDTNYRVSTSTIADSSTSNYLWYEEGPINTPKYEREGEGGFETSNGMSRAKRARFDDFCCPPPNVTLIKMCSSEVVVPDPGDRLGDDFEFVSDVESSGAEEFNKCLQSFHSRNVSNS
jgi:hypothetical protein